MWSRLVRVNKRIRGKRRPRGELRLQLPRVFSANEQNLFNTELEKNEMPRRKKRTNVEYVGNAERY